jgi:ribosomal protein L11
VRASDVVSIARVKAADVPHIPLASVARSVAATARSMGIKVVE